MNISDKNKNFYDNVSIGEIHSEINSESIKATATIIWNNKEYTVSVLYGSKNTDQDNLKSSFKEEVKKIVMLMDAVTKNQGLAQGESLSYSDQEEKLLYHKNDETTKSYDVTSFNNAKENLENLKKDENKTEETKNKITKLSNFLELTDKVIKIIDSFKKQVNPTQKKELEKYKNNEIDINETKIQSLEKTKNEPQKGSGVTTDFKPMRFYETQKYTDEEIAKHRIDLIGNSELYNDSIFSFTRMNPSKEHSFDPLTKETHIRYRQAYWIVTRFPKSDILQGFEFHTPKRLTMDQIIALRINEDGISVRPELEKFRFETKRLGNGDYEVIPRPR